MSFESISLTRAKSSGALRSLSLTPLIDVIFMLLLFFMLATNFERWRSVQVQAPAASAPAQPSTQQKNVWIRVGQNRLELAGVKIPLNQLGASVQRAQSGSPDATVVVLTEPAVQTQRLIDVLDALRLAGVSQPTLAIDDAAQ